MSMISTTNPISDGLDELTLAIAAEGVPYVTRDLHAFHPDPVGVLVSSPTITSMQLASITFEVTVYVVSADPPSSRTLDRILAVVLPVMDATQTGTARPTTWNAGGSLADLPAYEITTTMTVPNL